MKTKEQQEINVHLFTGVSNPAFRHERFVRRLHVSTGRDHLQSLWRTKVAFLPSRYYWTLAPSGWITAIVQSCPCSCEDGRCNSL